MWERFCPHCGVDQFARVYAGHSSGASPARSEPPAISTPAPELLANMPQPMPDMASSRSQSHEHPVTGAFRLSSETEDNGQGGRHGAGLDPEVHAPYQVSSVPQVSPQWPHIVLGVMLGLCLALATYIAVERQYFGRGEGQGLQSLRADIALVSAALTGKSTEPASPAPVATTAAPVVDSTVKTLDRQRPADPAQALSGDERRPQECSDALKALALCNVGQR